MHIAVIGTGRIGGCLVRAWVKAGHTVVIGTRDPQGEKTQGLVRETGAAAAGIEEAARRGEVVALAVPHGAVDGLLPAIASAVAGKVVIDTINAMAPGPVLKHPPTTSMAEEIAARLPGARVVKAFNAQGAELIADPVFGGVAASNFFCGDDPEARRIAAALIADIGFEPVDLGPLKSARLVEALTLLWITATGTTGSRDIAFKLLRR